MHYCFLILLARETRSIVYFNWVYGLTLILLSRLALNKSHEIVDNADSNTFAYFFLAHPLVSAVLVLSSTSKSSLLQTKGSQSTPTQVTQM